MSSRFLVFVGGAAVVGAVTCGGTAVVDGGSGGSTGNTTGTGTAVCHTPDPVGSLVDCSTSASSGSGSSSCTTAVCDDDGNTWESVCEDKGCVCRFNNTVRCSCVLQGEGQFCTAGVDSCCPAPFPN